MGRPPCCDKSNVKRGLWTAEEDAKILAYVSNHGIGNWTLVPKKAGLNRCGKSCRLRWTNYLRPDLKHDSFTPQEEELIINLHEAIGSRWSLIAKRLPGRTDNDVKNYWNTKLRKKLMKMGIDPVTHKPVSQVLSDLGSISGLPIASTTNQMRNIVNKDKDLIMMSNKKKEHACEDQVQVQVQVQSQVQYQQVINPENVNVQVLLPNVLLREAASASASSSSSSSNSSDLTGLSSPKNYYSSQTSNSQAQIMNPPLSCSNSFDWSEFLQSEPFMCSGQFQQCDQLQRVISSLNSKPNSSVMQSRINDHIEHQGIITLRNEGYEASMGSEMNKQCCERNAASSFVDSILDRDSEIRAAFPELLDPSFDY